MSAKIQLIFLDTYKNIKRLTSIIPLIRAEKSRLSPSFSNQNKISARKTLLLLRNSNIKSCEIIVNKNEPSINYVRRYWATNEGFK
jgi:hypothetical protein